MPFVFNPFTGNFDVIPEPVEPGVKPTPTRVLPEEALTVKENSQLLITEEIDLEGDLDLDGVLVEVQ